jgi:hypothetical protein
LLPGRLTWRLRLRRYAYDPAHCTAVEQIALLLAPLLHGELHEVSRLRELFRYVIRFEIDRDAKVIPKGDIRRHGGSFLRSKAHSLTTCGQFYAARAQRTSASAIRSQDRRRLMSSARAAAAKRFAGIAASKASTAWFSRRPTLGVS